MSDDSIVRPMVKTTSTERVVCNEGDIPWGGTEKKQEKISIDQSVIKNLIYMKKMSM